MNSIWTNRSASQRGSWKRAALTALMALGVIMPGLQVNPAAAAELEHAAKQACRPGEDPCVRFGGPTGPTRIVLYLGPNETFDQEFHVRWSQQGLPQKTATVDESGYFVVEGLLPETTYVFAVQRCDKVLIGKDKCTGWKEGSVKTPAHVGFETTPNPNAAGNGIQTKPNPNAVLDNGIQTKPNPNVGR